MLSMAFPHLKMPHRQKLQEYKGAGLMRIQVGG
jgi:hypothetical protein